jgi:hypothetical protein
MDPSVRANAAQLAARNIKSKPKRPIRRADGALPAPVASDNSGGGLFGGSVQSPGSFNFSAPTPAGISFPSPFGGFSGNQGSSDNEDPRADTTGEEEKRRGMKFGGSSADGSSVPLFAPNPNASFSANQTPNLFGGAMNTQPTPAVGGFGFGSSTQNSAPSGNSGINFGSTAPASQSSTPFSFGATTSQSGANNNMPAFGGFGGTNSPSISEAPKSPFNFGSQQQSQPPSNPFNFNSPATQETSASTPNYPDNIFHSMSQPSSILGLTSGSLTPVSTGPFRLPPTQFPASDSGRPVPKLFFHQNYLQRYTGVNHTPLPTNHQQDHDMGESQHSSQNADAWGQRQSQSCNGNGTPVHGVQQSQFDSSHQPTQNYHTNSSESFTNNHEYQAPTNVSQSFGGPSTTNTSFSSTFGNFGAQNTNTSASFSGFDSQSMTEASAAPDKTPSLFAPATTSAPSTTNLFGTATTSAPSTSNLFGAVTTSAPSTSNLFGTTTTSAPSSSNMFGSTTPAAPASTPNLFGASTTAVPPPTTNFSSTPNPFTSKSFPPASPAPSSQNMFASSTPATSNIFNQAKESSTPNIFGNLNNQTNSQSSSQPEPTPATNPFPGGLFGHLSKSSNTPDLFGHLNKPVDQQVSQPAPAATQENPRSEPTSLFANANQAHSSPKPAVSIMNLPMSVFNFANDFKFASLPSAAQTQSSNAPATSVFTGFGQTNNGSATSSSPFKPVDAPTSANQPPPSGMFGSLAPQAEKENTSQSLQKPQENALVPASKPFGTTNGALDTASESQPNGDNSKALVQSNKGVVNDETRREFELAEPTEDEMDAVMPINFNAEQRRQFHAGFRMRSLNKAMSNFFRKLPFHASPNKALSWYHEKKASILTEYGLVTLGGTKRAMKDTEEDDDEDRENVSPGKRARTTGASSQRSQRAQSPEKRSRSATGSQSQSQANGNSFMNAPSLKPRESSPVKPSSSRAAAPESSPVKSSSSRTAAPESSPNKKRKPEAQMTKEAEEGKANSKKFMNGGGSSTSNLMKNILESPDKPTRSTSPDRKIAGAPKPSSSAADAPRANPFGNLPGAAPSPAKSTTTSSAFAPKATSTTSSSPIKPPTFAGAPGSTTPSGSPAKPPTFAGAPTSGIKPPVFASAPTGGIKPPTFGAAGATNFLAQFGQQAAKNVEDEEKKRMERAKEEDMDSDDDEAEWEAKYKEKRKAELKELEGLAKGSAAAFVPGKGFTFGEKKSSETTNSAEAASASIFSSSTTSTSKPLFGQTQPTGSGNSIFSSANVSGASSPGLFSSGNGSVLEGAAGKPAAPTNNIFGHLSKADFKADDEDESTDDEAGGDDEKNDPSYAPNASTDAAAEETGAGIASTKKPAAEPPKFNFGSTATSGTTTPTGGNLFSRMSKETTPVAENKENSEPKSNIFGKAAANPFASSIGSVTAGSPGDKTWNPNSPIKFGTGAPSVSVTESTPPPKPFANLFGNPSGSTLGSSTAPTTVGFQFGGASNASSLFPSAAPSAGTSRATSPGGTTDADSAAETEEMPKMEQVDLTKAGPGEENEDAVHEVRAKALKFIPKSGDEAQRWDTKGLGPLRVLKHKTTSVTRILMRQDPSGVIVLNKSLIPSFTYEAAGKTMKVLAAADVGEGLETWVLQFKDHAAAEALARFLESNKVHNK